VPGFLEMFRPAVRVARLWDVSVPSLLSQGCDSVLLDLDNTMLPWKDSELPRQTVGWIEEAKTAGLKLCIVSNTHYPRRLASIAEQVGVPYVSRALKPRSYGFLKALELLGSAPHRSVVIGDQILTDVWGGNRAGISTILVDPLHPREFAGTKVSRLVERVVLWLLKCRTK